VKDTAAIASASGRGPQAHFPILAAVSLTKEPNLSPIRFELAASGAVGGGPSLDYADATAFLAEFTPMIDAVRKHKLWFFRPRKRHAEGGVEFYPHISIGRPVRDFCCGHKRRRDAWARGSTKHLTAQLPTAHFQFQFGAGFYEAVEKLGLLSTTIFL
jgi:hypothetical protein